MFTIVTSYINYFKTPLKESTHDVRFSKLKNLLELQIPIIIYVSKDCINSLVERIKIYPNNSHIRIHPLKESFFESSLFYLIASKSNPKYLPKDRFFPKDTFDYMCFLHSKIEFLNSAVEYNPFSHDYFMWLDYNISEIWGDLNVIKKMFSYLYCFGFCNKLIQTPCTEHCRGEIIDDKNCIILPSCWDKRKVTEHDLCEKVFWRFTGNCLVSKKEAIQHLFYLYSVHFQPFLEKFDTMIWDINFWAYLEQYADWKPITYKANHDDTIINFPVFLYTNRFIDKTCNMIPITYPYIDDFYPSSCSFIESENENLKIINMRYVNYKYLSNGHCIVNDKQKRTKTKNLKITVNAEFKPISYEWIKDVVNNLPTPDENEQYQGIEDIRLYQYNGNIKFSATTVNYSGCARNRIVYGDYKEELDNVTVITPPYSTFSEKNWIPIIYKNTESFVYSWKPFKLGVVQNCKLKIILEYDINYPFNFSIRGSSNIIKENDKYIAIVHTSIEKTLPKQYYHFFIMMNTNLKPIAMSSLFYFDEYGPEFCLSLHSLDNKYISWISRKDRNPLCFTFPKSKVQFNYKLQ